MRYAIVIEKAQGNFRRTFPIFQVASPLVPQLTKSSYKFARLSSFTLMACAKMARPFPSLPAASSTWTLRYNSSLKVAPFSRWTPQRRGAL